MIITNTGTGQRTKLSHPVRASHRAESTGTACHRDAAVCIYTDGELLRRIPKRVLAPGEMEKVTLRIADLPENCQTIRFCIEEGESK